jgi:isopentenyl diphosphate isomerase/L-lactate dehydrogenase-like FMN-dependent dehydrogenase
MNIKTAVNIEDLRRLARRRLPRIIFDYIDGGVENETCLARNLVNSLPKMRHSLSSVSPSSCGDFTIQKTCNL